MHGDELVILEDLALLMPLAIQYLGLVFYNVQA